jgi:cytochrome c553
MNRRGIWILLSAGLLAVLSAPVSAGNPARGLEISAVCQACHGQDGNLMLEEDYPIIAGQHFNYLVHALRAYRDGGRNHAIMSGFARDLSDQDIRDLAAWYSRQQGPLGP